MATHSMGQYRYAGGLMTPIDYEIDYKSVPINTGSITFSEDSSFQDIQIRPKDGSNFIQDQNYYVKLTIPQDMNYAISFDVELIKTDGSLTEEYQFIQGITLEQGGNAKNVYSVALYEENGKVSAAIPEVYDPNAAGVYGKIYYDAQEKICYIGRGNKVYERLKNFNVVSVIASWKEELGEHYGVFEFSFRPVASGFTHLLLRMVRTAADYNMQRTDEDGSIKYGRKINKNNVQCELYALTDIIGKLSPNKILSRIGVWSHPGLLMVINGEEIRVTANGYYELDALPITSLSIAAKSYEDFFTIDYEYETE